MKIVSVINYKGGVGKTALTANLAAELAWHGKRVLMLDLDPQTSLTFSFILPDIWERDFSGEMSVDGIARPDRTIKAWLESFDGPNPVELSSLIHTPKRAQGALQGRGRLDLISSHLGLINVDLELAATQSSGSLAQGKKNFVRLHTKLARGVSSIDQSAYDLVLIDCPPNFNVTTKMAIIACDYLLVPARPDFLSTLGIDYLIRNVNQLISDFNDYAGLTQGDRVNPIDPKVLGVVFTMVQENLGPISAQRQYMNSVRQKKGVTVFSPYIKRNDTLFAGAPEAGVPVVLNAYSTGTYKRVVEGLEEVAAAIGSALGI
ncbi:MAG: ParA family protein [Acetobacteraceae bacterium]|nr:ParA family protein [Acetobacteraceae bacterium]